MNTDPALRVLLGLILLCLLLLVAQGFGLGAGGGAGDRYRISLIKSKPPWLMRVNSATGEVEQLELRDGRRDGRWVTLGQRELEEEGGEQVLDEPFATAPPAPKPTATPPAPAPSSAPPPAAAPSDLSALVEAIQPGNPREIRIWAASLLGGYVAQEPDTSIPVLVQALGDPDPGLVLAATRSLGASQHPDALLALEKLASHPDPAVQAAAREAVAAAK